MGSRQHQKMKSQEDRQNAFDRLLDFFKTHKKPATTSEIRSATGMAITTISAAVNKHQMSFKSEDCVRNGGSYFPKYIYPVKAITDYIPGWEWNVGKA